jgi:NDP-sugar pyrophosphorylase family protein
MQVVIVAGGRGTRMRGIAPNIPKPLLPINGKPILEYQIELAKRYGVNDLIILSGYLGDKIVSYFGNGRKWGVKIVYFQESMPLGNAGCLKEVEALLKGEFFVFYGDTIMDIALDTMVQFHDQRNALGTLFLHPNDHPFDSDLVEMNNNMYITDFFPKPHEEHRHYRNLVSAGLYILRPDILKYIEKSVPSDFGRHVFPKALSAGECIAGYVSPEYIKDMGTPERYNVVAADVISGKVARLNRKNKRAAFFWIETA